MRGCYGLPPSNVFTFANSNTASFRINICSVIGKLKFGTAADYDVSSKSVYFCQNVQKVVGQTMLQKSSIPLENCISSGQEIAQDSLRTVK